MEIFDNKEFKILRSDEYNFVFDKKTGVFKRWGKTFDDDPEEGLPEIADIEISEVCSGVSGSGLCNFCYKSNTKSGRNMSLETFKKVFSNLPKSVTQIAFGIGDIEGNPEIWDILWHTRNNGVIPNITINGQGITKKIAHKLASVCGAVAVSLYNKELTFDAVHKLSEEGLKQVNIHFFLAEETYERALRTLDDIKNDERLANLNALVFLSLKSKGRAKGNFHSLSQERFTNLVEKSMEKGVRIGFDSCSAFKYLNAVGYEEPHISFTEPCESTLFSMYINVEGKFFPCSFMEGEKGWEKGIDCTSGEFLKAVWNHGRTCRTRNLVKIARKSCVNCHHFKI